MLDHYISAARHVSIGNVRGVICPFLITIATVCQPPRCFVRAPSVGLIQLCSRKIHRAIARSRSGIWLVKAPLGGGVECACLLAFAYSDHNRSLIVFANEHDNYELVKLLILNTRVHWNYSSSPVSEFARVASKTKWPLRLGFKCRK